MSLTHADIQEILKILDDTGYDEMTLETERFTLTLKRSGEAWTQETKTVASHQSPVASTVATESEQDDSEPAPTEEGLVDIRAPMVGTFYRAPKPGADPFVAKGAVVKANTVIAIIEVMKLMNSVPAGVTGEVVEIHAEDAQFVDKGQLLMRARPT